MPTLFTFGHGYSAAALARRLTSEGWAAWGTTRSRDRFDAIAQSGARPLLWPGGDIAMPLATATHLLISAAPDDDGDPVLREASDAIRKTASAIRWLGYLSTTGVYGDHDGGWVDETTPLTPSTPRGEARVKAEAAWQSFAAETGMPLHIFRLAGIYGPGRGPFAKVRSGTARRIVKQGQVFSRIHVEDIAQVLAASIARPNPGAIYNLCDDDPAPPEAVIGYAAELLGVDPPPEEDYTTAEMTPMARSFYAESKRVRNDRIKEELGVNLIYPSYRDGLKAMIELE